MESMCPMFSICYYTLLRLLLSLPIVLISSLSAVKQNSTAAKFDNSLPNPRHFVIHFSAAYAFEVRPEGALGTCISKQSTSSNTDTFETKTVCPS